MTPRHEVEAAGSSSKAPRPPIPPSPHRTTSQLSTVTVHAISEQQNPTVSITDQDGYDTYDSPRAGSSSGAGGARSSRSNTPSLRGVPVGSTPPTPRSKERRLMDEPEAADVEVSGEMAIVTGDVRQDLKALMNRSAGPRFSSLKKKPSLEQVEGRESPSSVGNYTPRRYFVLTNAGKPVFCS